MNGDRNVVQILIVCFRFKRHGLANISGIAYYGVNASGKVEAFVVINFVTTYIQVVAIDI